MNAMQPLPAHQRMIARWLALCLTLVAIMVFVGGVTRLTESGLSIVEWKLVSGTLPPMSENAWQAEFESYKQSPQFLKVNSGFTVADFKSIFWLEYLHRLLGRVIGLVTALPIFYFAARGMLPRRLLLRCIAIAALVGAQGTVGWVMVASGLENQPRVEPIKLAAHLLLAFSVFSLMLWTRWQVLAYGRPSQGKPLAYLARFALALLVIQIFFGALVAGLRAGMAYNTYPLMDGQFIPTGLHLMTPWWLNHLENVMTVQFQHRMGAIAVVIALLILTKLTWKREGFRMVALHLAPVALLQFVLGVATLLSVVNLWLASAHQLMALALLSLLIRIVYLTPFDSDQHATANTA